MVIYLCTSAGSMVGSGILLCCGGVNSRGVILCEELRVMEQTVTAKIQIKPDSQAKQMLEQARSGILIEICSLMSHGNGGDVL